MQSMGVGGVERDPLLGFMSTNPLAVGSTVYGNGTQAPTRGPVDPSGYAERDLTLKGIRSRALASTQQRMMQQLFGAPQGQLSERI